MTDPILVLGVGNILLMDEAIGVRTVEYLEQRYKFPDNVTLMDGGTLGMTLMNPIMECRHLIVLDAVLGNGGPGSIYRLTGDNLRKSLSFNDSMHQTDLVDTLILCELSGARPEAVVIGMQPEDYTTLAVGLTPDVEAALPKLADALLDELRGMGVVVKEKE